MKKLRIIIISFFTALLIILSLFVISIIQTNKYNSKTHQLSLSGEELFDFTNRYQKGVSLYISKRTDSWNKTFNLNGEEVEFTAFTYDFHITNNSIDTVNSFNFKLYFKNTTILYLAWNGAIEIHQFKDGNEIVAQIPDLRQFDPDDYPIEITIADGEKFIEMHENDYLIYLPSEASNAIEMPIRPHEGATPGMIIYVKSNEIFKTSSVEMTFSLLRTITTVPVFWVAVISSIVWLLALLILVITSLQARKYRLRHERDFEIITESIETFTNFIDAKDPYTNGHSKRVALYTKLIAEKMGFSGEDLDKIYYSALLHDCGKIGVPDNVLGKPGKLTDEEFEIIKSHTTRGGEILSSFKSLEDVDEGAHYHHERYDGKGYPEGLKGEEIPLIARMICVADSFDAMNSNRVYRKKLSKDYIIHELENNRGTQFDPKIANIMLELIKEKKVNMDD